MRELKSPTPLGVKRNPPGPVVIWNLIRRCNLTCKHCYSISADKDFPGELSTEEVFKVMDDLKAFHVPVLILSGGEPLMRSDIFEISKRAKDMGFYVGLSTNGTMIDESNIEDIAKIGYDYVGISIDGVRETHDKFRRKIGAFDESMKGIRLCHEVGIKVGLRFTLTMDNAHELPALLDIMEQENKNVITGKIIGSNLGPEEGSPPSSPYLSPEMNKGQIGPRNKKNSAIISLLIGLGLILVLTTVALASGMWDPLWNPFQPAPDKVVSQAFLNTSALKTAHIKATINGIATGDLPEDNGSVGYTIEGNVDDSNKDNPKSQMTFNEIGRASCRERV